MKGIDVSHYNAPIDWNKVKSQIDFAILKLGNIGDDRKFWLDNTFETNYRECKRLGIPIGVYVYCYCNKVENARAAGVQVREYLSNKPLELPIYIDMEDDEIKIEGKNKLTEIVIAFNSEIEKANKWAGVYFNLDWINNYLHKEIIIQKYTTWIAHPENANNLDKYKGQYDVFQYSWKGHINGCNGNGGKVDMNIMYRNLIAEIAGNNPEPSKKSVDEIVHEVIDGLWGNGQDRKNRLEAAGYNYEEVQARVNKLAKADSYYPACNSGYKSLVDALNSIGVDSSYNNRKAIAAKNNVRNYTGTATQNNQILSKLKAGKLKRV